MPAPRGNGRPVATAWSSNRAYPPTAGPVDLPWLNTALTVRNGSRTVVAASSSLAGRVPSAVAAAESAAVVADRYAHWFKPNRYVVYLANPTEWNTWFGRSPRTDSRETLGVAVQTSQTSEMVMINMTLVDEDRESLTDVLRHKFGHVVTLLGRGDPDFGASLLVEGIADYIEEDGRPIGSYPRLDVFRYYVRSGRWNGDLDRAEELFDGDLTRRNVGYALGYLTWRCIADRYGTVKMLDIAGDALFDTPSRYAKPDLGEAWVDVKRACASYIRAAVR
jgi:hypothetical protein